LHAHEKVLKFISLFCLVILVPTNKNTRTVAAKSLKAAKNMTQKSSELAMETNFFMKLGT
jgi:hypothetical protein